MESSLIGDRAVLIGSRSWSSTPWDYSSMRYLQFAEDDTGLAIYGYGQTIFAKISFRFELLGDRQMRLSYLESPAFQKFPGFIPIDQSRCKDLAFSLMDDQTIITESITAFDFRFHWQLSFNRSPFPDGIAFPYDAPLVYYGYRENVQAESAT
jgi:hypothetical protein